MLDAIDDGQPGAGSPDSSSNWSAGTRCRRGSPCSVRRGSSTGWSVSMIFPGSPSTASPDGFRATRSLPPRQVCCVRSGARRCRHARVRGGAGVGRPRSCARSTGRSTVSRARPDAYRGLLRPRRQGVAALAMRLAPDRHVPSVWSAACPGSQKTCRPVLSHCTATSTDVGALRAWYRPRCATRCIESLRIGCSALSGR